MHPQRFPGQNLVEFALVSLLLLMGIFGIVDLGRAVYTRTTLTNAVREAARYGATNPPTSNTDATAFAAMRSAAQSRSAGVALTTDPSFTAGWLGGSVQCSEWPSGETPRVTDTQAWMPSVLHLPVANLVALAPALVQAAAPAVAAGNAVTAATVVDGNCVTAAQYIITRGSQTITINDTGSGNDLQGLIRQGDKIQVKFQTNPNCGTIQVSIASYNAPDSTWVPEHADQQQVYDSATTTVTGSKTGNNWYSLTIKVPSNYFQVDFVVGPVIQHLSAPNNLYGDNKKAWDNGGTTAWNPNPSPSPHVAQAQTATPTKTATATATKTATPVPPTATKTATPTPSAPGASPNGSSAPTSTSVPTATTAPPTSTTAPPTSTSVTPPGGGSGGGPTATTATSSPSPTATTATATATTGPTATKTATAMSTPGPSPDPPAGGPTGGLQPFQASGCASPAVGDKLTVCSEYDFNLVATRLIGFGTIKMNECANVTIQNNK